MTTQTKSIGSATLRPDGVLELMLRADRKSVV